ncbi:MAG: sugar ABC transporter ATP-binding protein [Kiritimatiellia bacterium]|jgi:ABC-type sugar transport system ATPase subunit|nr:sugar ABC transporter ATP-binding protein [Kiritimatiellia bacterium]MDP6848145.1 sugar ABC transporter ATP-binding protein [Kiritimatiellia bacterium]
MGVFLKADGINKSFGGVQALKNVSFALEPGEVHALIGENGAGKSTLGKIIAGVLRPDSGQIVLDGHETSIQRPTDAQKLGISIIFQELDLFPNLTVAENIAIGNLKLEKSPFVSFRQLALHCRPFLDQVGLDCTADTVLKELSIGQMQLVAIARSLSMDARVIVMDEATSSLTEDAVGNLFDVIGQLKGKGVSIVYVSHKMDEIFRIADRITVLRDGSYIGTRPSREADADELIQMMVGRELSGKGRAEGHATTSRILEIADLSTDRLEEVSFTLHRGEVLGIAGLVGSGRSEIGAALFGLDKISGGTISLKNSPYSPSSPRDAVRKGIGLLPEDRKLMGLIAQMSVKQNMSLASLDGCSSGGWVEEAQESSKYLAAAKQTRLKTAGPDVEVTSLSGGNQQKVLVGRWLMVSPDVYFLDDPTRGVDVGAKEDIYAIIEELAAAGKGILFVSSELPELLRCCDRIMVMHNGRMTGIMDAMSATQEGIMSLAMAMEGAAE